MLNTVLLTAVPVIASVVFGVGIALLLNRYVFGRGFLRTLIISPFLVMPTAAALVWKFTILDTTFGILNFFLRPFGMGNTDWIGQHSQLTIIAFLTWMWTPFMVLLALAGLQSQGLDQLEAARVDGAGSWRIFRSLTLPQLRPYIELGVLLGSIYIVQAFKRRGRRLVPSPQVRSTDEQEAKRRAERTIRQGRSRFILLSLTLFATAVVVALVMFRALYLILE